jgi:glycosyltransferase involved in cell wall biosynthesis/uncharacterized protein YjbI with pentapeptide repeats
VNPSSDRSTGNTNQRVSILLLLVIIFGFLALQYVVSLKNTQHSTQVLTELRSLDEKHLVEEKTRQEAIAARIKNEEQSIFLSTLISNLTALMSIIVALTGAWIGVSQFLMVRRKESFERAAMEFNKLWEGISNDNVSVRAASIAGLQTFVALESRGFHGRAALALSVAARREMSNPSEMIGQTLGPVLEHLVRVSPEEVRKVSWQSCRLKAVDLSNVDLTGIDFRDASLQDCNFNGSALRQARFDAAKLKACLFEGADLSNACLDYSDFAYASIRNAKLAGATLTNFKLLDLNMEGADLTTAKLSAYTTDWRLARGWRNAKLEPNLSRKLLAAHGPKASGPRVLMLLWEYPPIVSGGQWTAAYHFLKNLRLKGISATVVVPYSKAWLDVETFGNEHRLVGADIFPDRPESTSGLGYYSGSGSFRHVGRFASRLLEIIDDEQLEFDVIHGHDWLTFEAAETAAKAYGKPWIAHFHSLEADRTDRPSHFVASLEENAVRRSTSLVAPSAVTRQRLISLYKASPDKITVIPNPLSTGRSFTDVGYRQSDKVVFTGRLSTQKGPDLFIDIAKEVWHRRQNTKFWLYGGGTGDEQALLNQSKGLRLREVPKPFSIRPVKSYLLSPAKVNAIAPLMEDGTLGETLTITPDQPVRKPRDQMTPQDNEANQLWQEGWEEQRKLLNSLFAAGVVVRPLENAVGRFEYQVETGEQPPRKFLADLDGVPGVNSWSVDVVELKGKLDWSKREAAFYDAAVVVVPSRFEPFGMVVLEAMQHGVPVLFPKGAGVAEVVRSGVPIDPQNVAETAEVICRLLDDDTYWAQTVQAQYEDIDGYSNRNYEEGLIKVWNSAISAGAQSPTASAPTPRIPGVDQAKTAAG